MSIAWGMYHHHPLHIPRIFFVYLHKCEENPQTAKGVFVLFDCVVGGSSNVLLGGIISYTSFLCVVNICHNPIYFHIFPSKKLYTPIILQARNSQISVWTFKSINVWKSIFKNHLFDGKKRKMIVVLIHFFRILRTKLFYAFWRITTRHLHFRLYVLVFISVGNLICGSHFCQFGFQLTSLKFLNYSCMVGLQLGNCTTYLFIVLKVF